MENSIQVIERLKQLFNQPLPGENAQLQMEPITRKVEFQKNTHLVNPYNSSILILLYPIKNELYTAMIKRPKYDGVHSGQIAFPGGKAEKSDKNLLDTALREANEEVGIIANEIDILGNLSELYIPPSNFNVMPYVAYSQFRPKFILDKKEVDELIEISIKEFTNPSNIQQKEILSRKKTRLSVPCYYIKDHIIWGASAMIISEFCEILKQVN